MTAMVVDASLTLGGVLARVGELLRGSIARAAIVGTISAAGGVAVDASGVSDGAAALNFLLSILTAFLQYWLILTLLDDLDLKRSRGGRFGGYFVLGIVAGLGILLGFVLLVIPGLIVAARWSLASPILIASEKSVFEALRESWRATRDHLWVILGAILIVYLPPILLVIGGFMLAEALRPELAGIVAANVGFAWWIVGGCYLGTALYTLLAGPDSFSAVFE